MASNVGHLQAALSILLQHSHVHELRALNTAKGTQSGYFDDLKAMAQAAGRLDGGASGVFVLLNPANPDLLARASNRVRQYVPRGESTTDQDILGLRWLLVDFDPVRPAGISSTEAEHEMALDRAHRCRDWLITQGCPVPLRADSGNGSHLLVPLDLPNDKHSISLLKGVLATLGSEFTDDKVRVDPVTFNPARLTRLYGTLNRKGDPRLDRPHRQSRLLECPSNLAPTPHELLEELAGHVATVPASTNGDRPMESTEAINLIPVGQRNETLTRLAGAMRRQGATEDTITTALLAHNDSRIKTPLPDEEVESIAQSMARYEPAGHTQSDSGNALRLADQHGHGIRYCKDWRKWLYWDSRRWAPDRTGEITRLSKQTVARIYVEASTLSSDEERKSMGRFAVYSESRRGIDAMIALAESEPEIAVTPEQLDTDLWLPTLSMAPLICALAS